MQMLSIQNPRAFLFKYAVRKKSIIYTHYILQSIFFEQDLTKMLIVLFQEQTKPLSIYCSGLGCMIIYKLCNHQITIFPSAVCFYNHNFGKIRLLLDSLRTLLPLQTLPWLRCCQEAVQQVPFLSFLASSGHFVFQFQSHTLNEAFLELFKYTPDVLHIYKERQHESYSISIS